MPFLIALIAGIIQGVIFGFATQTIIESKGYRDNWFWWGFFFGLIALIVACAKPQNTYSSPYRGGGLYQSADAVYKEQMLAEGGWKCSCGKVQASYVSTCSCGKSKRDILDAHREKKQEELKKQIEALNPAEPADEMSKISAIKEYKGLMDAGLITQEEFEVKKKQLLGL